MNDGGGVRRNVDELSSAAQAYVRANIECFVSLLEALRSVPSVPLIYASSSSIYGTNTKVPTHLPRMGSLGSVAPWSMRTASHIDSIRRIGPHRRPELSLCRHKESGRGNGTRVPLLVRAVGRRFALEPSLLPLPPRPFIIFSSLKQHQFLQSSFRCPLLGYQAHHVLTLTHVAPRFDALMPTYTHIRHSSQTSTIDSPQRM